MCRSFVFLSLGPPFLSAVSHQEYMSRSLGVPATQHAFEDVALQFQAMKMNLNPEVRFWSGPSRCLGWDWMRGE